MPLVLICGYPSSGKSRIAGQIKDYLESDKQKVVKVLTENSKSSCEEWDIYGWVERAML